MSIAIRLAAFFVVALAACTGGKAAELQVFAAASLSDALAELAPLHAKATGNSVRFNLAASGLLVRQIKEGAPADVFISADEARMNQLDEAGLLAPDTRRALLANTLVLVAPAGRPAPASFAALAEPAFGRLAIGVPATVPAGDYARRHLEKLGLWTALEPKLVQLDNVRAVLAAVEAGNADAGIVYRTDALASKKVVIAVDVPRDEGPVIVYPAAVVRASRETAAARAFLAWLATAPEARAVFEGHGFAFSR